MNSKESKGTKGTAKMIEKIILAALMFLIIFLVTLNVIFRFCLGGGFSWSNELVQILFFWTTLLGSAVAFRDGGHMGMGILDNLLPPKIQKVISILISAVCITYLGILGYQGYLTTLKQMASGQISASVGTPEWLVSIAIPIGCAFSIIWLVRRIVHTFHTLLHKSSEIDEKGGH